jgi:uncharacterized RDD family membrane protein YckC
MQWYYSTHGQRLGPVPHAELERLIEAGTLTGDTLLWRQGMDQWKTLDDVRTRDPAMFAFTPPPPLPEPTPASAPMGGVETPAPARRPMRLELEESRPPPPEVLFYAGFWRRAGAFLIDSILWLFVWNILTNVVALLVFPEMKQINEAILAAGGPLRYQPSPEEAVLVLKASGTILLIGFVWAVIYDLVFITRFSATPGKLLFGLRIVTATNKPPGFLRIVARCMAKVLSGVPTLFIGYLIVAFDDQKRSLHDFLCSTRVVKKR